VKEPRKIITLVVVLLLLLGWGWWSQHRSVEPLAILPTPIAVPTVVPVAAPPKNPKPQTLPLPVKAVPVPSVPSAPSVLPTTPPEVLEVPSGQEGMRRDLIPRGISIARCYYTEEVVNPGTQFYFSINGSGFDANFQRMIRVDADALDVEIKNLELVTANQIRGLMVVGEAATTQYIYPKIFIRGLPVFRAPDPFGVVRPGEVLDIQLLSINESGQWGQFRLVTNLDHSQYTKIKVEPTSNRLEVSNLKPKLPFYVEGTIEITPGLASGSYGLKVSRQDREIFRKQPVVDVIKPNVGKTGSVESVEAQELAQRPGDQAQFSIKGSGFSASQQANLTAQIPGLPTSPAAFTYVSQGKYEMTLRIPINAPVGYYGLTIQHKGKTVFEKKRAFAVVPADWLSHVQLNQPVKPGEQGTIQIVGRDLSASLAQTMSIQVDEPGLVISALRWQDPRTLTATLDVASTVALGDYILHVYASQKELKLPRGNIIKIGVIP